jgi:two-component system sensor histidine kinase HydH
VSLLIASVGKRYQHPLKTDSRRRLCKAYYRRVRMWDSIVSFFRSATFRIGFACVLVLAVGVWGMLHELAMIESFLIKSLISQVRSNSERTVVHLEQDLYRSRRRELSSVVQESSWLTELWDRTKSIEPIREFRAVLDANHKIIAHTDPEKIGKIAAVPDVTPTDLKKNRDPIQFRYDIALAGDQRFVEIRVPVRKFRGTAGYYVSGISAESIAVKVREEQQGAIAVWLVVIGCAVFIVAITGVVLYRLARRATSLESALETAENRRLSELSLLLAGMAHEVRNPLNSIRLNLHTSEKVFLGETTFDRHEVLSMLSESVKEVERVNEIISQLLGLARHDKVGNESSNAAEEITSAIQFFRSTFDSLKIGVQFQNRITDDAFVMLDRPRFRQILVNLITNAQEALPDGGTIEIQLDANEEAACLRIADSGNGVEEAMKQKIFEPFVSTRANGTGLGLSVVRSMVQQVGGAITCERSKTLGGAEFLLRMPRAMPRKTALE